MRAIAFLLALLVVPPASAMAFSPSDLPTPAQPSVPASAPQVNETEDGSPPVASPPSSAHDDGRAGQGSPPPSDPAASGAPTTPAADEPAAAPPSAPTAAGPKTAADVAAAAPQSYDGRSGAELHPACAGIECTREGLTSGLPNSMPYPSKGSALEFLRLTAADPKASAVAEIPARRLPEAPLHGAPLPMQEARLVTTPAGALDPGPPLAAIMDPEGTETSTPSKTRPIEPAAPTSQTLPRIVAASALGALLLALLYSRIARRDEALRSDRRVRIIELLTQRGPMALPDLTREMGCDRTTVTHHLRLLSRLSHVVVERVDGRVVAALPGQPLSDALAPRAPDIIERLLREAGGTMTRADLHAAAADLPLRTRNHALARLAAAGRIMRVLRAGTEIVLLTTPQGSAGVTAA